MTRALIVHPGTQHVFQLAGELNRLGLLAGLHTSFAAGQGSSLERMIASPLFPFRRLVANRRASDVPAKLLHLQIGLEIAWQARRFVRGEGQGLYHWRNERFQRSVPERCIREADVVIGFDTSTWVLAERCDALGRPLILIQTIGHPSAMSKVAEVVASQFPNWHATMAPRSSKVREAEQIEHDQSDRIVCSSSFTRGTLVDYGIAADKISVVPHGVNLARFAPGPHRGDRPFRFLFVGSISARKGIPLLISAWRRLAPVGAELWLIGSSSAKVRSLLPDLPGLKVQGPVSGERVPEIMRQCDVFVFPSYFEGFGRVVLQAMACGLPVITTTATAGPDLIGTSGAGGWVIPTGDEEALIAHMGHCLTHQSDMREVGRVARLIAERHSWQAYGRNWIPVLEEVALRREVSTNKVKTGQPHVETGSIRQRHLQAILLHPGTQYSYQLARELQRRGRLTAFHTGLAIRKDGPLDKLSGMLPDRARRHLTNRYLDELPKGKLRLHALREMSSLLQEQFNRASSEALLHRRNEKFQLAISDTELGRSDVVIGFDTSSWQIARRVKKLSGKFILDQSIGHPMEKERIFKGLRERYPAWGVSVPQKLSSHMAEEEEEHALADLIVVPSTYVKGTLVSHGVAPSKIRIIPFGTDLNLFHPSGDPSVSSCKKVFLFVGSISARKGVPVLLEAWRTLRVNNAELWLIGPGAIPSVEVSMLPDSIKLMGPKSRADVARLMRIAHVFVFPSFFEGLAQVQIEALSSGLPVISTREAGAEDLIENGRNGFIVSAGDTTMLAERMQQLIAENDLLATMRQTASRERDKLSWTIYGDRWSAVLDQLA